MGCTARNGSAGSAAACSRSARRYVRSPTARNGVRAATPPAAFGTVKLAAPCAATVTDTATTEGGVAAPGATAPTGASPRPMRSAIASASRVARIGAGVAASAASANAPIRTGVLGPPRRARIVPSPVGASRGQGEEARRPPKS